MFNTLQYILTAALLVMCLPLCSGCNGKHGTNPPTGAATVEELLERYRRAHKNKDIADLRGILIWESQLSHHRPPLEKPMVELFEMPLSEVRYVSGPKLADQQGAQARYLIGGHDDGMIGPLCGKVLLVEKTAGDKNPHVLDPSYIVVHFHEFDNRYYIDILQPVAEDAAYAYKTDTPPKYIPQPLEVINNPYRKKK